MNNKDRNLMAIGFEYKQIQNSNAKLEKIKENYTVRGLVKQFNPNRIVFNI